MRLVKFFPTENKTGLREASQSRINTGGAIQSRTGLAGFAIRCITALLSRPICFWKMDNRNKKSRKAVLYRLERETSLELATSTLARLRSPN